MNSWITACGSSDEELSRRCQEGMHLRFAENEYTAKDVEYIQNLQLRVSRASSNLSNKEVEHLRRLCQLWDVNLKCPPLTSHRPIVGPIIVTVKRLFFPVVRLFMRESFKQQREFNANVITVLTEILNSASCERQVNVPERTAE
ncbi:MAG: hypothetical protein J5J00_05020 [Deltaproteobacteria bacterium]|nr:hypothetical protein [Deltaproteobacteria bacterium]